ncbi:glycosyltransferase family 2 protein [Novosphingobium sp. PS1R-30]|uniref:Glycosyltransferase family 2 protein n=1 Tax=Novosphingobium anseongense TaxID=3133436 RepID=A0ABU8RUC8_9SPHN
MSDSLLTTILVVLFIASQVLYLCSFFVEGYFYTRPVNWVDEEEAIPPGETLPYIVLLYPVLRELETTMRTTFKALAKLDYPADRFEIVAIPNHDDASTIDSLERLSEEFTFLKVMPIPPTSDPSWEVVWAQWESNPKAYWWHAGNRAKQRDLPAKKTRQMIYAFYQIADRRGGGEDFLLNYIDADSAPAPNHFLSGARGIRHYDVLQSTNVAGNLNSSLAASFHAFDHMIWDGRKYAHMTANGRHPFWVLGKGLFFKGSDLVALGGFNPWTAIEDPEVGMRFWKNGRRLGMIATPLIEEVPETFGHGITQRKRWVAGFFQSLTTPLKAMDFTFTEKLRAWLNFAPCLSLAFNIVGLPVGIWALVTWINGTGPLPEWTYVLAGINMAIYVIMMGSQYWLTWKRTKLVLDRKRDRLYYILRVNPLFIWIWWFIWLVPLWIGWGMYRRDHGLTWERTEKIDANAELVRRRLGETSRSSPPGRAV